MPTYAYRCSACSHEFDQFQRFSEDALTDCPECQGLIRRVLQPVSVVFKGSGWYINDSRKSPPSENGGSDKSEKKDKSDSGDSAKAEKTEKTEKSESKLTAKSETAKPKAAAVSSD